jgi:hypothetical protein
MSLTSSGPALAIKTTSDLVIGPGMHSVAAPPRRISGDPELFAEQIADSRRLTPGEEFLWQFERQ